MNAKVFGAWVNGTWTEVKAFKKENAVARLQESDARVCASGVYETNSVNAQQAPVEEL